MYRGPLAFSALVGTGTACFPGLFNSEQVGLNPYAGGPRETYTETGGACYYLARGGESCNNACFFNGDGQGCNLAGTVAAAVDVYTCHHIVMRLGSNSGTQDGQYPDDNSGCTYQEDEDGTRRVQVMAAGPPTCEAINSLNSRHRVCACDDTTPTGVVFPTTPPPPVASTTPPPPVASCPDCAFDLTALEEFSVDYSLVQTHFSQDHSVTTEPLPAQSGGLEDHGTLAVHARNVQLKLDNHFTFPDRVSDDAFNLPPPVRQGLEQGLAGVTVHEELHINGLTGQASFHLGSPALNLCFQVDHFPPVAQIAHDQIEQNLQQAEQIAPMMVQMYGLHCTMDGAPAIALEIPARPHPLFVFDASSSAPLLVGLNRPNVGLKFDNYVASVGDQFSVRACEVETHSATQSMMAANPESREFIASRIAEHQQRLQVLLEPAMLNTRFNFIPLEIADQMMAPAAQPCITNDLVQIPPRAEGTFQTVVFSVCSFVVGMATLGALHKKRLTPADAYHQVSA